MIDNLKVEPNFFLISHYKCLYNGIGETIKGETTHANLRTICDNQILTSEELAYVSKVAY